MKKELKVFFETTNYCNYKCIYCFANTYKSIQEKKILEFEKFKKIINSLSSLNFDLSVLLEGGEPLTIDNICKYGEYAKTFAKKVALGSNVSLVPLLSPIQLNNLKNTFEEISVGFDTTDPKLFYRLTNYPIENALKGIDILLKQKIPLKICTVVTKYNVDFFPRETNDHSLAPTQNDFQRRKDNLMNYKGELDIKLNKEYRPYGNIVVSSNGDIKINVDSERKNMKLIGTYDNFIDNLKHLIK